MYNRILTLVIITMAMIGCSATKSAHNNNAGFRPLFDGKTTTGWHTYGKTTVASDWKVDDGMLHLVPGSPRKGGDIVTNEEFDNFHLKLEWKISQKGNSGVIFYIHEDPAKFKNTYNTGPEMQVLDNEGHADGKIHKHRAGDLYDLIPSSEEPVKPVGEWNLAEIISNKGKLEFFLNGKKVVSTTLWNDDWKKLVAGSKFAAWPGFGTYQSGKIALQDHNDQVWYRNIMIKEL